MAHQDLLLGSTATAGAKFGFLNVAGGTPTASISANSGANATTLSGLGVLGTTNAQTLTLGNASTGNIVIDSGTGLITLADSTTLTGSFTQTGSSTFTTGTGQVTLAGNVDATNGLDVTTANLTVGGTAFTVDTTGAITSTKVGTAVTLSGAGATIGFTGNGLAQITTVSNNHLALMPNGTGGVGINTTSPLASLDIRGNVGTTPGASVSANTSAAALVADNRGTGDIFTASSAGLNRFVITQNGNVGIGTSLPTAVLDVAGTASISSSLSFRNGAGSIQTTGNNTLTLGGNTTGNIILSPLNGAAGSFVAPSITNQVDLGTSAFAFRNIYSSNVLASGTTGTFGWFQRNSGSVVPTNITDDFLLGSTATASAKFGFLNVAGGTPTASISANSGANASYLTGAGNLATTNMQTLTLGGSTTGTIVINPASGLLQLTPNAISLTGSAPVISASTTDANVQLNANGAGTLTLNNGTTGNIQFFSSANSLTSGGNLTLNGTLTVNGGGAAGTRTTIDSSGNVLPGTSGGANVGSALLPWNNVYAANVFASGATGTFGWWQRTGTAVAPSNITDDLLLGSTVASSAKFGFINVNSGTPTATISAGVSGATYLTANGVLATTAKQPLTLRDGNTGDLYINGFGTGVLHASDSGKITSAPVSLIRDIIDTLPIENGGTNTTGIGLAGSVPYSNGTGYAFSAVGNANECLISGATGSPTWSSCGLGDGTNWWKQANGALYPINSTLDFLLGGIASSSARAAFLNIAGGTPTASLSAGVTGGAYLSAAGSLATTAMQTLNLGGATTGDIVIDSGTGVVKLPDLTTDGPVFVSGGQLSSEAQLGVGRGGTGLNAGSVTSGQLLIGNASGGFTLNTLTAGTGLSINNASGVITISQLGTGASKWTEDRTNGVLYPNLSPLDLLVGGTSSNSAKFAVLNVSGGIPTASVSAGTAGGAYLSAAGSLATTAMQTLNLGGATTGDVVIDSGTGIVKLSDLTTDGVVYTSGGNGKLNTESLLNVARGGTGVNGSSASNGQLLIGNGSGFALNTLTAGSGITITPGAGSITIAGAGSALSKWTQSDANGVLYPNLSTLDLLVGGSSSNSAKFAVLNVNSGTPTASVSANSGANATTLSGLGVLGTTNKQTLTLGNSTTGEVILASGGTTALTARGANLIGAGTLTSAGLISANGGLTVANAQNTTLTGFAQGALLYTNGSAVITGLTGTSSQILHGGTTPSFGAVSLTSEVSGVLPEAYGGSPFESGNGSIFERITNQDLLIGGVSTASAKFAVLNVNSGTPTASISANSGANGVYLTGNGTLATTNRQTLTIGNSATFDTTGQVLINPNGTGNVGIGTTSPSTFKLQVAGSVGPNANGVSDLGSNALSWHDLWLSDGVYVGGSQLITSARNITNLGGSIWTTDANTAFGVSLGASPSRFNIATTGRVGIGTDVTSPLATLDVRSNVATLATASVSGSTNFAGLLVDNSGSGDLFTASKAGVSTFTVTNTGQIKTSNYQVAGGIFYANSSGTLLQTGAGSSTQCLMGGTTPSFSNCQTGLEPWQTGTGYIYTGNTTWDALIGGTSTASAKFAFKNVAGGTPTASISAISTNNALSLDAAGNIFTTNMQTLTLGNASTGNIVLANAAKFNAAATFNAGATIASGQNLTLAGLTGNNSVLYSTAGSGIIAAATTGTSGLCLTSGASNAPSWQACPGSGSGASKWTEIGGLLYPNNATDDVLIGGTSTASAKFAFYNVSIGTPTASVSAGTAGGAYLTADGKLATTAKQTLTLGDSATTGNIVLANAATFNGGATIASGQNLTLAGITGNNAVLYGTATTGVVAGATTNSTSLCLLSGASNPSWQACPGGSSGSQWTEFGGLLYPTTTTDDVLVGGNSTASAKFAFVNVSSGTPTASVSAGTAGGAYLTADGKLATTAKQTLTLGDSATTGNIVLANAATFNAGATLPSGQNLTLGGITSNNSVLYANTSGVVSGVGTTSTANLCLLSGSGAAAPSWGACDTSPGVNLWQAASGTIQLKNQTQDLLIGGIATSSAKFAVLNVNSGTPTASISANSGANAATLTGTGVLGTTNKQTLTLGNASTGEVVLAPGGTTALTARGANLIAAGTLTVSSLSTGIGHFDSSGVLTSSAVNLANSDVTGILPIANGGSPFEQGSGAITERIITQDLLIGGVSTASAKFGFINVNNGTPTATISGNIVLDAAGSLQTTKNQTLTLGGIHHR